MKKRKIKKALLLGAGAAAGALTARAAGRKMINKVHDDTLKILMTDLYDENLWEIISSVSRIGIQTVMETNLRSTEGQEIERPMGPHRPFPNLDNIMFSIGQMYIMPTPLEEPIDTTVIIGKKAKKPLIIDMPVMIAPMAYGAALSRKAKVALAKGAANAGTASCTGEGPFLTSERKAAKHLIYQYNRGDWGKTPEIMEQCDAIEIQLGQGSYGGVGHVLKSETMDKELRNAFHYPPGKDAVAHSRQPEVNHPKGLKNLVTKVKTIGKGVPVGVKMAAGRHLEADLDWVCSAGIDFISLEGGESATKGSPPILQDDFGVPLLFAIPRAVRWLKKHKYKDKVSLIACGKIRTPGQMLKVCALGADASYIGAISLFAMSHDQVLKAMPFEPPTQLVWYDGKYSKDLDVDKGASSLSKFLTACNAEIIEGIRALGKTRLSEINTDDIFALDELTAKACHIPMAYEPFDYGDEKKTLEPDI